MKAAVQDTRRDILEKASLGSGLSSFEVLKLIREASKADWRSMKEIARSLTEKNFAKALYFFAPLYFSSVCVNDCSYCGFRRSNRKTGRRVLTVEEFAAEARSLWNAGHRTLLLVAGEHFYQSGALKIASYLFNLLEEGLPFNFGIEVGPLELLEYRALSEMGVTRMVLYQETYDREVYRRVHPEGPKRNFDWRYEAPARALAAGISQVGIGFLAGLGAWEAEVHALIQHADYLERETGKGPATVSIPRLRPASGMEIKDASFELVSDEDYEKILLILRLALPKTGIVLSTRESMDFRNHLLEAGVGVTHLSAGVSTEPGGYHGAASGGQAEQFEIADERSLFEVAAWAQEHGFQINYDWGNE